jgi:hypothetical protein
VLPDDVRGSSPVGVLVSLSSSRASSARLRSSTSATGAATRSRSSIRRRSRTSSTARSARCSRCSSRSRGATATGVGPLPPRSGRDRAEGLPLAARRLARRDEALEARRRARAAVALRSLGSWAVIGFDGHPDYPELLRRLSDVEAENSYSAYAILVTLGSRRPAHVVVVAARAPARARVARARGGADGTVAALTLALAAGVVLTPILWLHYLVLLVVPIALARPRLSALWFVPLAMTVFELPRSVPRLATRRRVGAAERGGCRHARLRDCAYPPGRRLAAWL